MKRTTIALPDWLFEVTGRLATTGGESRSEFCARAITAFVLERGGDEITAAINRALENDPRHGRSSDEWSDD